MAVDYFQPETFQQANPILSGIGAAQQLFSQGMQNAYLPQNLQAQLQQLQLANQASKAQLPYVGPQAAANVGLTGAQTGLIGAQTQFFPITAQAQYLRGMGDYLRGMGMNSPGRMTALFQRDPAFQAMVANNPQLGQIVANNMANSAMYGAAGMPMPGIPQPNTNAQPNNSLTFSQIPMTVQQQKTLQQLQQNITPQESSVLNSFNSQTPQNSQNANNLLNPSDYKVFGDTMGSSSINATTPTAIKLQRTYSQSFDQQFQPWISKLPDITNFAGAAGKANLTANKYASAFGLKDTPQYQNWNAFVNAASELSGNELRRSLGINASVAAKEDMEKLMEPGYWNENPADALSRFNALLAAKKANDQVLTFSQNQTLANVKQQANAPTFQYATQPGQSATLGNGQYQLVTRGGKVRTVSDSDLAYTAQQNNMTVQQVKQKLGIR